MVTPHLTRRRAPEPPPTILRWLWNVGFVPTVETLPCVELACLERWSAPLSESSPGLFESALTAATTRQDGRRTSPDVTKRRYSGVKSALRAAVNRDLIDANPIDRVMWSAPRRSAAVNILTLPSVVDVAEIVSNMAMDESYSHYAAFFATVGFAGLRPSEAARLRVRDLDLPSEGWGEAHLGGALTSPGPLYTVDGSAMEEKGLKQRNEGETRAVPLPPVLVRWLRWHVERFEKSAGDRVFTNQLGHDLSKDNWRKPWRDQRARRWPDGHKLFRTRPYDLRHTAATMFPRWRVAG